jgi:hypothetical protein
MPNGQHVLVQTLPLRPAGAGDRDARDRFERELSLGTLESAAAGDPILAHRTLGGEEDRTMVWILPLAELSRPRIRTREELLGLGIGVLIQLADRHGRGQTAPLLSEHAITAHGRLAGAQVFAAGPWLAEDVDPIRVAPEERLAGRALPSGDVFRLGQMLSELARDFALPPEISAMVHPDPEQRPAVSDAIDRLDAALAGREQPRPEPPTEEVSLEPPLPFQTIGDEPELGLAEPLSVARTLKAVVSLAIAGLSAGGILSLLPG